MATHARAAKRPREEAFELPNSVVANGQPLWQYDFAELTGHNLERRGRKEVNQLLSAGWRLLHVYTLRYQESGVWRERPMAILGRLRNDLGRKHQTRRCKGSGKSAEKGATLFPIRQNGAVARRTNKSDLHHGQSSSALSGSQYNSVEIAGQPKRAALILEREVEGNGGNCSSKTG
jgi:hypothetical protein